MGVLTAVNPVKKPSGKPPQDEDQGPGRPTSGRPDPIFFRLDRFLPRADGWKASPPLGPRHVVQHFTAGRNGARVEIEYEITRSEDRRGGTP